jgi:hypothetical protein
MLQVVHGPANPAASRGRFAVGVEDACGFEVLSPPLFVYAPQAFAGGLLSGTRRSNKRLPDSTAIIQRGA